MADVENEEFRKMMERFGLLRESISEAELDALDRKDKDCRGHYEDKVFLQYLGRHCNALLSWKLPEGQKPCGGHWCVEYDKGDSFDGMQR